MPSSARGCSSTACASPAINIWRRSSSTRRPSLRFDREVVTDGRALARPVNYLLLRIVPAAGVVSDPAKRSFALIGFVAHAASLPFAFLCVAVLLVGLAPERTPAVSARRR